MALIETETLPIEGMTASRVEVRKKESEVIFHMEDGRRFMLYHQQYCCENVILEDVCGEVSDLEGVPLSQATKVSHQGNDTSGRDVWTFYIFRTLKGTVTLRWYGSSNGYYSEEVYWEWMR